MIKIETGFGDGEKIISSEVKYILTAAELDQLKREAFEAGQNSIVMVERIGFSDYLKQRNREQALSELVADGEKNGDYDDHLKQRKES